MTKIKRQQPTENAENQQPTQQQVFVNLPISLDEWNEVKKQIQEIRDNTTATRKDWGDETIGIDETCKILGISRPTFHRWKNSGLVPFVKVGKTVMMKRADIINLKEYGVTEQ